MKKKEDKTNPQHTNLKWHSNIHRYVVIKQKKNIQIKQLYLV